MAFRKLRLFMNQQIKRLLQLVLKFKFFMKWKEIQLYFIIHLLIYC